MYNISTGRIIYWNANLGYGFIECSEHLTTIFFHKSNCGYENIQLFDIVTFKLSTANSKKHKGKSTANSIHIKERGDLKKFDLRIGTIKNWNGKFGLIDYPTDGKKIFLYYTRLLFSQEIQNEDLVVFNPVVSTKDTSQLFAFFAYPISFEKDNVFLRTQYENYQIPLLKDYILSLSGEYGLSIVERLEFELMDIGFISTGEDYSILTYLLNKYHDEYSFIPDYDVLSDYVSEIYLIQLWESSIINTYNIDSIKKYFIRASADTKRLIIQKVNKQDKEVILESYFVLLKDTKRLERVNNDLKTFLSIVYRNIITRNTMLYEKVKSYLLVTLTPNELIGLWLNNYIDDLSQGFIFNNFDLKNTDFIKLLLQKKDENGNRKYEKLIFEIYEQYFINILQGKLEFEQEYVNLVQILKILEENNKDHYDEIIKTVEKIFASYHKFVLWILGAKIQFNALEFVQGNVGKINHYYRVKFILRYLVENFEDDIQMILDLTQVEENKLSEFAKSFKWNDVIYPTEIKGLQHVHAFLDDVHEYNIKCNKNIDIINLADTIYNTVEKYNEIHIRLWMYFFSSDNEYYGYISSESDNNYYDYIGFREYFKKLSNEERKIFRKKSNNKDLTEVTDFEALEVIPCMSFEQDENESFRTYNAFVENIYFGNSFVKLRLETGEYTKLFLQELSSTGLNRIPLEHFLNKIPIKFTVKSSKIFQVEGLDDVFTQIHTGEIAKALKIIVENDYRMIEEYAYSEDWQLRKQIIEFLNAQQDENFEITLVNEPKNFYRRLYEVSELNSFEKIGLYTIKLENEFAIIWENIDFSFDRATYVFKCQFENYYKQIEAIIDAITSIIHLRSTLSSTGLEKEIQIFKNKFGFITSIRKQRGKNESFSNWLQKFKNALDQKKPDLPTDEELEEIRNWTPEVSYIARLNKSQPRKYKTSAIIKEEDLAKTNLIERGEQIQENEQANNERSSNKLKSIYNALKIFNQYFTENLKFDTE